MIKKYYKIEFRLLEPLSLGSGENRYSDCDLLRDSRGYPFIPASSLCGVYRSFFDQETADQYFGFIRPATKDQRDTDVGESLVTVYDAVLKEEAVTSIRDGVGLDEYKTARTGAKFDLEVVEPGCRFITYLEQDFPTGKEADIGRRIAERYLRGEIMLGRKSMRGYGHVAAEPEDIWERKFNLSEQTVSEGKILSGLENWLSFDLYGEEAFGVNDRYQRENAGTDEDTLKTIKIELKLVQRGGISIRSYTTDLAPEGESQPDYSQMSYSGKGGTVPYIPGTSWAGAFRHHISGLLPQEKREELLSYYFGTAEKGQMQKSRIRFSESMLKGDALLGKNITRTALNRFTGGAVDGALYTERTYFGGETSLVISFPIVNSDDSRIWRQTIAASVADLDTGFLAVGGLTAVGRGLFRVKSCQVNGAEVYCMKPEECRQDAAVLYTALDRAFDEAFEKGGRTCIPKE